MSKQEIEKIKKIFEDYSLELDPDAQHLIENDSYFTDLAKRIYGAGYRLPSTANKEANEPLRTDVGMVVAHIVRAVNTGTFDDSWQHCIDAADTILSLITPMEVLSDEEVTAVERIYRTQVTSDQEWFNNPARQMQLMAIAYRAGKQARISQATVDKNKVQSPSGVEGK